jgi:hypothetical protein
MLLLMAQHRLLLLGLRLLLLLPLRLVLCVSAVMRCSSDRNVAHY